MSENPNDDLEAFRKQWREEVFRKQAGPSGSTRSQVGSTSQSSSKEISKISGQRHYQGSLPSDSRGHGREDDYSQTYDFDDLDEREEARKLGMTGTGTHPESRRTREPVSALEHYEEAVERERQGKLGESLRYYRQAFRVQSLFLRRLSYADSCSLTTRLTRNTSPSTFRRPRSRNRNRRSRNLNLL